MQQQTRLEEGGETRQGQDFLYKHEEPGGILGREARRPELCLTPPLTEALRMPKGR